MSEPDGAGSADYGADDYDEDDEELYNPISYEREPFGWEETRPEGNQLDEPAAYPPSPDAPYPPDTLYPPVPRSDGGIWPDESWPPRRRRRPGPPRWLLAAAGAVVVAAGVAGTAFWLAGRPPARPIARPSAPPPLPPAVTVAQARAILARHASAANAANSRMDTSALGGFETGSSQALDASSFTAARAENSPPDPAVSPARPRFYIPREGSGYPHWFAVAVSNQSPGVGSRPLDTQYLVFTQSAPGAPWLDAVEPYLLGDATAPRIALDPSGYATAVDGSALPQATADALNDHGSMRVPPNLADTGTETWGQTQVPGVSLVTDYHAPADYPVLGLRTVGGGALVFYTDTAAVTFTAAQGKTFRLSIAGFFSQDQPLSEAGLLYLEQFATYDPPRGGGAPQVVADYSGVERKT